MLVNAGQTPPDAAYYELERRAADLYTLFPARAPHAAPGQNAAPGSINGNLKFCGIFRIPLDKSRLLCYCVNHLIQQHRR